MNIIKSDLKFRNNLAIRTKTTKIVLHHADASNCTVNMVHNWHLNNGWSGIGYHFLVRKDGTVYEGRPLNAIGSHCLGQNNDSIGICFEGNFEKEKMGSEQLKVGTELVLDLMKRFNIPTSKIYGHKDLLATSCPGKNFPLSHFKSIDVSATETKKETVKTQNKTTKDFRVIITAKNGLNVRKEPNTTSQIVTTVKKNEVFTIVDVCNIGNTRWGKLKSGAGWICMAYTEKVK